MTLHWNDISRLSFGCRNIKVLRSQLSLVNNFYPDVPADETVETSETKSPVSLCKVCRLRGPMICGKCKSESYCGQLHQKLDWKNHKQFCCKSNELQTSVNETLFPEFEIVIEQEEDQHCDQIESEKEADKRRFREYEELVQSGKAGVMSDCKDLNEIAETKEDKAFSNFKKSLESYETQVLRYNRHGSPLWISDLGKLNSSSIPKCSKCSGTRTFEFQIMPQMLNELKNYELDWGVITIYTCENDCDIDGKYVFEFAYKQDIIDKEEEADGIEIKTSKLSIENETVESDEEVDQEVPSKKPQTKTSQKKEKEKFPKSAKHTSKKAFEEAEDWE